jgi:cellulose biosynthesis protein BcsQ
VKIFATYNIKGGVGKTTAAVNLAYLSAADGCRTLLWDLDPQGAASFLFRIKPRVKGGGKALIRGTKALDDAIKGTDFDHLDLLPADFTYRNMDLLLGGGDKKHLAGLGERHARGRRAAGAADPHHAVGAHAGPAHRVRGRLQRSPPAGAGVLLDGRPP